MRQTKRARRFASAWHVMKVALFRPEFHAGRTQAERGQRVRRYRPTSGRKLRTPLVAGTRTFQGP
jgi:hypothetical protein